MDNSIFDNTTSASASSSTTQDDNLDALESIIPNETISTNDESVVGSEGVIEKEEPPVEPTPEIPSVPAIPEASPFSPESVVSSLDAQASELNDIAKTNFIRTYTKEFDDTLHRATQAIQKILDSIDTVIRDNTNDIMIPSEASEFLDEVPKDGKVPKFEEAREIVNQIIVHAEQAKQQSEQAAAEAAQIYDEVQKFKRDTEEKIAELTTKEV